MAILEDNDILQARIVCFSDVLTQVAVNVRYYRVFGMVGPTIWTTQHVANHLDALLAPMYKACLSEHATYRGVSVNRIFPGVATLPDVSVGAPGSGTVAGGILPGQVSGIITLRTAFSGVRWRGRNYIPFPGEADNVDAVGLPLPQYVENLQDIAEALAEQQVVQDGGDSLIIHSGLWHQPGGPEAPKGFTRIWEGEARRAWATQRRRGSYGKMNTLPF